MTGPGPIDNFTSLEWSLMFGGSGGQEGLFLVALWRIALPGCDAVAQRSDARHVDRVICMHSASCTCDETVAVDIVIPPQHA